MIKALRLLGPLIHHSNWPNSTGINGINGAGPGNLSAAQQVQPQGEHILVFLPLTTSLLLKCSFFGCQAAPCKTADESGYLENEVIFPFFKAVGKTNLIINVKETGFSSRLVQIARGGVFIPSQKSLENVILKVASLENWN